ncbi:MAG: patatin-like phospholipase family protein [Bacteroidales bacterium]|nr:patatin-like phospholipase family protein [Bacteroidales bacterium]
MKKPLSLTLLLLLLTLLPAAAQRPKVGVVLCGGGAKGAAHVGVLKVLEENDIPIDMIVGTSMGAIVGGLYAIGYSASELDSLIMAQDWNVVMSDRIPRSSRSFQSKRRQDEYILRIPFGAGDYSRLGAGMPRRTEEGSFLSNIPLAMVDGQNIYNLFTRLSVGYQDSLDFNRMPIPFACVAVDLIGKKEVVFRSGHFVDAIRSSMAIPGYFSPVRIDNMVLIDGGALNNYPVDVARAMGADIIIGVKLGELENKEPVIENIGDLALEVMDLFMDTKLANAIADTDILITPGTKGFNTLSFDTQSLRTLIDNGEAAARSKEEDLRKMKDYLDRSSQHFIGPMKQPERYRKALRLDRDSITLGRVSFDGLSVKDAQWMLGKSCLKPGARISGRDLEQEITNFYNTAAFQSVTYLLRGQTDPYDLELNFVAGRPSELGLGVRFDSEEVAAILLGININAHTLYGSKFSVKAKLAYNMQAEFKYAYAFKSLAQFDVSYALRSSNLNILNQGMVSNMGFTDHSVTAAFSTARVRNIDIRMGTRLDFFNYRRLLTEAETLPTYDTDLKRNKFLSVFFRAEVDRRDQQYYPMRGFDLTGEFNHYFNHLFGDQADFSTFQLHACSVIPAGSRLAFTLSLDNRTILCKDSAPLVYGNYMGGFLAGRYLDHQIPFIGFTHTHVFKDCLTIATWNRATGSSTTTTSMPPAPTHRISSISGKPSRTSPSSAHGSVTPTTRSSARCRPVSSGRITPTGSVPTSASVIPSDNGQESDARPDDAALRLARMLQERYPPQAGGPARDRYGRDPRHPLPGRLSRRCALRPGLRARQKFAPGLGKSQN